MSRRNVLIMGGNGLIGSEIAAQLIADGSYDITVLSRGTVHFDVATRVFPHVRRVTCDRHGPMTELAELTSRLDRWHFVVDCTAYYAADAERLLALLGAKLGHYVYISSDSVYEVCAPGAGGPSREADAVRPADAAERDRLAKLDEYGDGKLAVEEFLRSTGAVFTALRLPDVLGPRDTTRRLWAHLAWLQYGRQVGRPVPVPRQVAGRTTSYVYVVDVARAVRLVMARSERPAVARRAFNLSLGRDFTLPQLLAELAAELGVSGTLTEVVDDPEQPGFLPTVIYTLPSVERGPVDIGLARSELGFEPTPWEQVRRELVRFYRQAFHRFPEERQVILENLKHVAVDDEHREQLEDAFREDVEKGLPADAQ